ncbi:hypothetical protein DQ04_00901020 [Trypanosoma grayi]|uniref:hypothetical protein n=1 Tax=Trypanosoma grayi TaxID=71804 RepID=UPI0004F3F763|nr:hypothetical protein DQ04_00901020 [Trypanosoma grayi]KEG13600.1 hypothetical protein DQ04_00901020 [Trypanosoma grayi]
MFSRNEVDALFNDAAKAFQRSQLLLEERSRGAPPDAPSVMPKSASFEAALRGLRGLAEFTSYIDASEKVGQRLREEARKPSPFMEKKRRHGSAYPLLRRVVEGLVGLPEMSSSDDGSSIENLWASGAVVSEQLLLAGLFADWLHGATKAAERRADVLQQMTASGEVPQLEELRGDDLFDLLSKARVNMPEEIAEALDTQVVHVACSLPCDLGTPAVPVKLAALLLFPSLIPYIVVRASPSLAAANIVTLVERSAAELLPTYLATSPAEFHRACVQLVQHVVLVETYAACSSKAPTTGDVQRVVAFTKRLFDALLVPAESAFAAALPRAGMTFDVHNGLAEPLFRLAQSWLRYSKSSEAAASAVGKTQALLPVWCTASYRGLAIVEALAHAELGVVSGRGNATAQQKKYHSMLRQSNGRVTTAILSAVTEDRQLLFEETAARSAQGHKVCRIHEGAAGPSVFVYVDNGTVYMKVGRERAFRRAKSVEEVFSIFASLASPV